MIFLLPWSALCDEIDKSSVTKDQPTNDMMEEDHSEPIKSQNKGFVLFL